MPAEFEAYSLIHLLVVLGFVGFTSTVVGVGLRLRRRPRGLRAYEWTLGGLTLLLWVVVNGVQLLPENFDVRWSLPLHVTDVTALLVAPALALRWRWTQALLYFWGLHATLAFVIPDLRSGPGQLGFWLFWASHYAIVGAAIYVLIVPRFWPGWRDLGVAVVGSILYVAVVLPIDLLWNLNYGYLGRDRPGQPPILSALGPWPWRIGVMLAMSWMAMALLAVPWEIWKGRMRDQRRENRESDG